MTQSGVDQALAQPTAGLSSVEPYLTYWRRRQAAEHSRNLRLADQARADALRIADMLREEFGVTRVLLFGSLASDRFLPDSDIDLAVAGLPASAFFSALAQAGKFSDFPVDLKPLEALDSHFRDRVLENGEDL